MASAGSSGDGLPGKPPQPPHGHKRQAGDKPQTSAAKRRERRERVQQQVEAMGPDHPGWVPDPCRPDRDEYRLMRDMARQEGYQEPDREAGNQPSHFARRHSLQVVPRPKHFAAWRAKQMQLGGIGIPIRCEAVTVSLTSSIATNCTSSCTTASHSLSHSSAMAGKASGPPQHIGDLYNWQWSKGTGRPPRPVLMPPRQQLPEPPVPPQPPAATAVNYATTPMPSSGATAHMPSSGATAPMLSSGDTHTGGRSPQGAGALMTSPSDEEDIVWPAHMLKRCCDEEDIVWPAHMLRRC